MNAPIAAFDPVEISLILFILEFFLSLEHQALF